MQIQFPLVFFTLFLCLASGMLGFQGALLLKGKGTRKFHLRMLIIEVAAIAVGGFASFLHLHHWERIFNGFMHVTSGITQELIGIVAVVVVLALLFVLLRRGGDRGNGGEGELVPAWAAILALVVAVAMGFICAHSYEMPSRPAWNNLGLFAYYYASEFLLGAVGTWCAAAVLKQDGDTCALLARIAGIAGIVCAVVMVACAFYFTTIQFYNPGIVWHTTDPTAAALDPQGVLASVVSGENAPLFWIGAVLVGALAPAIAALPKVARGGSMIPAAAVALVCALAGGVCYRVVLYIVAELFFVYF